MQIHQISLAENNSKIRINNINSHENHLIKKHNSMDSVSFKGLTYYGGRPYTEREISDALVKQAEINKAK